jgi:hypothetical protein
MEQAELDASKETDKDSGRLDTEEDAPGFPQRVSYLFPD